MIKKGKKEKVSEIELPISGHKIFISSRIDFVMMFSSLVRSFSMLDLSNEQWSSLTDDEKSVLVDSLVGKSLDFFVKSGVLWAQKKSMQSVGKGLLEEAELVGSRSGISLKEILISNKNLFKRNVMQKILADRNDQYTLWAHILNSVDGGQAFGDKSIIISALQEALS